jgi:hypothetical protein
MQLHNNSPPCAERCFALAFFLWQTRQGEWRFGPISKHVSERRSDWRKDLGISPLHETLTLVDKPRDLWG